MLLIYLAGYLVSVHFGLQIFLKARLCLALLAMVAHIGVARYVVGVPISKWFYTGILITSVASAMLVNKIDFGLGLALLDLLLMVCVFSVVSLVGIAFFEQSFVLRLIQIARSRG